MHYGTFLQAGFARAREYYWELFLAHLAFLSSIILLTTLPEPYRTIAHFTLVPYLTAGMVRFLLHIVHGELAHPKTIFLAYRDAPIFIIGNVLLTVSLTLLQYAYAFFSYIFVAQSIIIGLTMNFIILYLLIRLMFVPYALLHHARYQYWRAIKESWKITRGMLHHIIVCVVIVLFVTLATSILGIGFGYLFVAPFLIAVYPSMYLLLR